MWAEFWEIWTTLGEVGLSHGNAPDMDVSLDQPVFVFAPTTKLDPTLQCGSDGSEVVLRRSEVVP